MTCIEASKVIHISNYVQPYFALFTDPSSESLPRTCDIYSPSLTTAGGVMYIPSETQNMTIYCICRIINVAVGPINWYFNGTRITLTQSDGSGNPYTRDNVPSPLIIPSFNTTHVGKYACGSPFNMVPSTIFLAVSGKYV